MQYINGQRQHGSGEEYQRINPATGHIAETYRLATAADAQAAVTAASAAFPDWSHATQAERSEALLGLATELDSLAAELAEVEAHQTGKSIRLATNFDVPGSIDNTRFFAGASRNLTGLSAAEYWPGATSMIRREPLGVCGSISPWNYPLQMAAWKVLPAIAAGNTVVLKASEMTPGTSLMLAEAASAAGIPAGVINIIAGTGPEAGEALVTHPQVAMTSFTGSTAVGKRIMELAAGTAKRVHLELGGKAPFVVFDDADLEAAARGAVAGALINGGQDCTAATRAYVARDVFEEFTDRVASLMSQVRVGDPLDPATDMGALISVVHRDRVAGFVDRARAAGAIVRCGGQIPADCDPAGAFYSPTLLTDVQQDAEVVQTEIFGPVLVALPFDTDEQAYTLANDSPFGLAASAWSTSLQRAMLASQRIQAGTVWINEHIPIISELPHGGFKQSGFGKDMSQYSFDEYTQIKHVLIDSASGPHREWQDIIFSTPPQAHDA